MIGIGIDLCDVARIEKAIRDDHFLRRVFTQAEREYIALRGAQSAAGIFAAKEAAVKALGTGFDGFFTDSVEITRDEHGCPVCVFAGRAREIFEKMGARSVLVSITHSQGMAAAVAVIE
ncbi:MAG: holo-ACP synthase [Clostridia bacterium]|nr:holo-ACP synthase [Clostridia bacterium]